MIPPTSVAECNQMGPLTPEGILDRTKMDRLRRQFAAMSHQFNPRACNRRLGLGFEELNGVCNRHNVLQ